MVVFAEDLAVLAERADFAEVLDIVFAVLRADFFAVLAALAVPRADLALEREATAAAGVMVKFR